MIAYKLQHANVNYPLSICVKTPQRHADGAYGCA